jgi:hypothetical protein
MRSDDRTGQQRETPQPPPPPPKLGADIEDEPPLPDEAQLKEEITFFTSFDKHLGHSVLFSAAHRLCRRANLLLHFRHMYS